jgi:hypothetical protein
MSDLANRADRPPAGLPAVLVILACMTVGSLVFGAPAEAGRPGDWHRDGDLDRLPPALDVLPTLACSTATDLTLKIRVADRSGPGQVALFVRGEHDTSFRPVELTRDGSVFTARIHPTPNRGRRVGLYVEATDAFGNGPSFAGSAERPLTIPLVEERGRPVGPLTAALGVLGAGVVMMLGDALREHHRRRRRARASEERFWRTVAGPFAGCSGDAFTELLNRVCSMEVDHPARGRIRLRRAEVLQQVRRLRGTAPKRRG